MADLQAEIRQLLDKQALHDLALRYARAIDRRDPELLQSLYHDDGVDEHGTVFKGSAEAFARAQPELMKGFEVTAHYIINTLYRIDGDSANGEIYFLAYHRTTDETPTEIMVGGRYLDRYARRDGQWKILHRILVWDHFKSSPVDAGQMQALRKLGELGKGRADISSDFLPLLHELDEPRT